MKNIKIKENELITLIEKIVNEQSTDIAFGSGFEQNMGVSKPTDKYKDLNLEGDDIEEEISEEEVAEEEIVERLRKRMGPRKFPKKVNETISEQTTPESVWTAADKKKIMDDVMDCYSMLTKLMTKYKMGYVAANQPNFKGKSQ